MFTARLIPASSAEHPGPFPHPIFHAWKIEKVSANSGSIADDTLSALTVQADKCTGHR
jgi:hypothetical protein